MQEITPKPLQIMDQSNGEALHFCVDQGLLIVACKEGRGARATVAKKDDLRDESQISRLLERMKPMADHLSTVQFKIIGEAHLGESFEKIAAKLGCKILRKMVKTGPFEIQFFPSEGRVKVADLLPATEARKIKVMVVDDSRTIRELLTRIIRMDHDLEVVAAVADPSQVMDTLERVKPDVVTMDLHMPGMDGVTLIAKYLPKFPVPTIIVSSISLEEGPMVLQGLEAGAVDYIQKPSADQLAAMGPIMIEKIKAASKAVVATKQRLGSSVTRSTAHLVAMDLDHLIVMGASTGGTEALKSVLMGLPEQIPPILIVQHLPGAFTRAFAERLDQVCRFRVREAADGDEVQAGLALVAPGGMQMSVHKKGQKLVVRITDDPPVNRHKPSVDYLFDSVAQLPPQKTVAVILTGMGADGAKGMSKLKAWGARTLAQDEASCVVFGMPKEAIRLGGVEQICSLEEVASTMMSWCRVKETKRSSRVS